MSQFKPYPAYKDSGVEWLGAVPEHWSIKRFKQVFNERSERTSDGSGELMSVSAYFGVRPRSEMLEEGDHLSRAESLEGYKVCRKEDLVMNIMLAWNRGLGFAWKDGIVSPAYSVFSVVDASNPKFLDYLVRTNECIGYFKAHSAGVIDSRLRLYPESFGRLYAGIPSQAEQTQISQFLDHETARIDVLIEEQQRLIELLKEKRQTVISLAVTKGLDPTVPMKDSGVEWLGEVPAHWAVAPTSYRYEIQLGRMLNEQRAQGEHLKPYLRVLDVQWGAINSLDLPLMDFPPDAQSMYRLKSGDLLVNEGGSYVGRSAIWRGDLEECYYQKALHRLRARDSKSDTAEFFLYVMEMATQLGVFIAGGNQTTIDHLTAEQLRQYRFAFPPLKEQEQIAEFISAATSKISSTTSEAEKLIGFLQERRSALISAAVTGKIDVRGWHLHASSPTRTAEVETV